MLLIKMLVIHHTPKGIDCVAQRNAVHEQRDFTEQVPKRTIKHALKIRSSRFWRSLITNPRSNLTSEASEAVLKRNLDDNLASSAAPWLSW